MRSLLALCSALLLAATNAQLFKWKSTGPLVAPKNDGRGIVAVKDPTAVYVNGTYHLFFSTVKGAYNMGYTSFTDWNNVANAKFYYFADNAVGSGYNTAPQIFYFAPQQLWYLVFQNGNAGYSTNKDISNFNGWSSVKTFYNGQPATIKNNIGGGYWVDMWVICDDKNCHLFSSDDNGHLYRSQTPISQFPNGMSEPVIALSEPTPKDLFEASNMYKIGNKYLLLVECGDGSWNRYFRSWTSDKIEGPYTKFADTASNPFAGKSNVQFDGRAWTNDISHGDVVRRNPDQTMEIKECAIEYVYQGLAPGQPSGTNYNDLPWRLALLEQTNDLCAMFPGGSTPAPTSTSGPTSTPAPTTKPSGQGAPLYGQCGGIGWSGPTTCAQGSCKKLNDYYFQCV